MAQFARPTSTDLAGDFFAVGAATIHEATDEVVTNDSDYATVQEDGNEIFTIKLGPLTDPSSNSNHTLTVRFTDDNGAVTWTFSLLEGVVLKAQWTDFVASPSTFQNAVYTLSGVEADAITDYTNLYVRVEVTGFGIGSTFNVSQIFLQVPDSGATPGVTVVENAALFDPAMKIRAWF